MDDILDSTGGGAGDIVSFFLRVALLVISGKRRLLILDEPFKGVDAERKPIALQVLKELTEDLGIQVICVTHDQKIVAIADQVIKVRKDDGKSFVEVV
jgi:DNA repair exonuclease SbcCD ATPase subunit